MPVPDRYDAKYDPVREYAVNPSDTNTAFVNDKWLAARLQMKISTIRGQRFKRRHGLDHWLTIDAVRIGSKPRYRLREALDWLEGQADEKIVSAG